MARRPEARRRGAVVLATAAAVAAAAAAYARNEFEARIEANASYTDNVEFASKGHERISDFIFELVPGFSLIHESDWLEADVEYELQSLHYSEDDELSQTYHNAALGVALRVVPQWFSVIVDGHYGQRVVEPERTLNFDNLFITGNLMDESSLSVTPTLAHEFRNVAIEAGYTYGVVDYSGVTTQGDVDDAERRGYHLRLASPDDDRRWPWEITYRAEDVTYETALPYTYENVGVLFGMPLGSRLTLLASGGSESDLTESTTEGGLNSGYWRTGLRLERDPRTEFEVWFGHRFFGDSYQVRLSRRARVLRLTAAYSEEPQTESERVMRLPTDSESGVSLPLDDPRFRPTSEPYLLKAAEVAAAFEGHRTTVTLMAFRYDQDYLRSDRGEENNGISLRIERRFGPRTIGSMELRGWRTYFAEHAEESDDEAMVTLLLTRAVSERLSLSARAVHIRREGPSAGRSDVSVVTLGLTRTF